MSEKPREPPITIPKEMLVYASRLSEKEKIEAFSTGRIFQVPQVAGVVQECITEVVQHRMILAGNLLEVAKRLVHADGLLKIDEPNLRTAVNRAYYAIHHSIRAAAMHANGYDPDGHSEAILALTALLGDNAFRAKSGLAAGTDKKVEESKANRGVADYSPFELSRFPGGETRIKITGGNWPDAAKFNLDLADRVLVGCLRFVGLQ